MRRIIWVFIFISMFFSGLASASNSSTDAVDNSSNEGADMVSQGIEGTMVHAADSMVGIADDVNANQPKRASGEMALFGMITVNYDPFQNPGVVQTLQNTSIIFLFLFVIFVFGGMAYVMIHQKYPQTGETLDYALNMEKGFDYKEYVKTLGSVIIFILSFKI